MLDRKEYISHINDPEQIINMRRVVDKIEMVMDNYSIESTDFLNPYERKLAKSILNRFSDLGYKEVGGLSEAERKIIMVYPDYYYLLEEDYDLRALEISDHSIDISHRDILGSLMGLGINREKIGDISVHKGYSQVVMKNEIFDYVLYNLEKVAKENVKIREIQISELLEAEIFFDEKISTVASMRLDAVISMIYNISRKDSQNLINGDRVKVNWEPINKVAYELEEKDLISIKGFGRCILYSIDGLSKKNRVRLTVRTLK